MELELPPPMVELQALPTASAVTSAVESETDVASETKRAEEDGAAQVSSRSPSTLNISTMGSEIQVCIKVKFTIWGNFLLVFRLFIYASKPIPRSVSVFGRCECSKASVNLLFFTYTDSPNFRCWPIFSLKQLPC